MHMISLSYLNCISLSMWPIFTCMVSSATINQAASFIDETYGKLDILVNNAGISLREGKVPPSELDVDVLKPTLQQPWELSTDIWR